MYDLFLNKKALIVDDFSEFRISLRSMLEAFGCQQIDSVKSGAEAVAAYEEKRHEIVLCDYNLGDNQNGQQVLEEISLQGWLRADGAFVMVTAESTLNMVIGALEFRPDEYLTKPINKANLKTRLTRILKQKAELVDVYKAQNDRNFAQVITCCKQHLANNSRYKGILYRMMAEAYLRQEKPKEASQLYQKFVDARPAQWSLLGLAQSHYMDGKLDACIQIASQAIEENPNTVEAYDLLASCHQQKGNNTVAQNFIQKALAISSLSIRRQRQAATLASQCGDTKAQLKALKQICRLGQHSVQLDPDDQARYLDRLLVQADNESGMLRRRMLAEAQQQIGALQKQAKANSQTSERTKHRNLLLQSRLSATLGDKSGAEDSLTLASFATNEAVEQQDQLMLSLFKQAYKASDQEDKVLELNQMVNKAKKERQAREQLAAQTQENKQGIKAYEQGDIATAIMNFRKALAATPESAAILLNLVQALMKQPLNGNNRLAVRTECLELLTQQRLLADDDPRYPRYQSLLKRAQLL